MNPKKHINEVYLVRLFIVYLVIMAGFAVLISRAFYLEVVKGRKYAVLARRQYSREITLLPSRGIIMDREGRILAESALVDSFYADPLQIKDKRKTALIMSKVLGVNSRAVSKKLSSGRQFVWIKRLANPDAARKLLQYHLRGVYPLKEYRRFYPNVKLASSVLGFVGIDSRGLAGIELSMNKYLRGNVLSAVIDVDGHNKPVYTGNLFNNKSISGDNIVTTIDLNVQFILEEALKKAIARDEARNGIGIIMNPKTGEVLAMATVPDFNPNIYMNYQVSAFKNDAVENTYEPGSIFKPFIISSALNAGVISPDEKIFCNNGEYRVYNIVIREAEGAFGMLSISDILKYSSNIGAAKIGEKLGATAMYSYLRKFGFGARTGIDLPGESSGILNPVNKWSGVSADTISFGQGVSATPIQLVAAMSAIADGGLLFRPMIIKEIRKPNGEVIAFQPVLRKKVISEKTAELLTNMLIGVVEKGGTGVNAGMTGYTVAGKTGTAQIPDPKTGGYYKNRFVASFLGFVPAHKPKIVMLIMLIDPLKDPYGGTSAAPVFKEVAEKVLPYLGVPSRLNILAMPSNKPSAADIEQAQNNDAVQTGIVPDFTGKTIRDVLQEAKRAGISNLIVKGSGYAVKQRPKPYTQYSHNAVVVVFSTSRSAYSKERMYSPHPFPSGLIKKSKHATKAQNLNSGQLIKG